MAETAGGFEGSPFCFRWQQCLNFFVLPQGHGAFLSVCGIGSFWSASMGGQLAKETLVRCLHQSRQTFR